VGDLPREDQEPQAHHPPGTPRSPGGVFLGHFHAERPEPRQQLRRGVPAVFDGGPHAGRPSYEWGFVGPVPCAAHAGRQFGCGQAGHGHNRGQGSHGPPHPGGGAQAGGSRPQQAIPRRYCHGTVPDKATRGAKYLAAKLAIVQDAKVEKKIETVKTSEAFHSTNILTKPLQGEEFVYKRGQLLGLEVTPPARPSGHARVSKKGTPVSAVGAASVRPQPTKGGDGPPLPCVRFALPEEGVPVPERQARSKKQSLGRAPGRILPGGRGREPSSFWETATKRFRIG